MKVWTPKFFIISDSIIIILVRTLFVLASLGLHGIVISHFMPRINDQEAPIEGLELSIAPPQGEALFEEKNDIDSSAQAENFPQIQKNLTSQSQDIESLAEASKVLNDEAPIMTSLVNEHKHEVQPDINIDQSLPETDSIKQQSNLIAQQTVASEETFSHHTIGVENGITSEGGVTRAAYASAVKKEIAKNRRRPNGDWHGNIILSFVIGPNGRSESISIVKSVNPTLDEVARSIINSIQLPPPPGGNFPATITIKFE
jgi:protein TonB